ncbi:DUF6531 domain-containing protein [Streptomyces albireticuli]|uniref:Type IV secretion protein Rhs n=1 Tax=Streptomyces albireticuli TaxID=1940 RepID=A0A2A2CXY1_9ACTN|nr:DUF6531 domain-containing protein [Streptomyces albireticuli]MCD9141797.1 DUF6531 domain-containing protein [Streptomyces albireticuli]MCD9163259.1 DUF6531 domain-containing protein [Streptomyces albireticuli]MCD9189971.1 DUF6531 domain-containing protein [Streptomyces albireticuli]PAU45063.1 hypothetical protein CK936_31490 [Streptomyces albireticuli]
MSIADEAKNILEKLGLDWPDGDPGKLRKAATAWNTFADSVDKVRTPVNTTARSLIHNNKGEAIEAFETFWNRYANGDKGWLFDVPKAARQMAKALEKVADAIDDATDKLWTQIWIDAGVIVAGVGLAFFTAGLSTAASATAAAAIIELGTTVGIAISTVVAEVAATTLVAAAFGGVEAVTVELAVAQTLKISTGLQDGVSLDDINAAAKNGMIYGGAFGGFGSLAKNSVQVGGLGPLLRGARPNLLDVGTVGRPKANVKECLDPIDVATGAMTLTQTDVTLPGALPLVVSRTHLSTYRSGGWFGPTWASTLDERVQLDAEGVVFVAADGMRLVYPVPRPGTPTLPVKGPRWPLEWDGKPDGVVTVTDPFTGVVRTFGNPAPTDVPGAIQLPLDSLHDRNDARVDIERTAKGVPYGIRHSGGYYVAIETEATRITGLRLLDEAPSLYDPAAPAGRGRALVSYGYDAGGNLTEVTNSSGKPLCFAYDAEGRITSWTDRNASSYAYFYDERGRVVRTEGSDGFLSGSLAYDDETRTTTVTDSLGNRQTLRYNSDALVVEETDALGHTTLTEWDERGENRLSVTDPLGRTTRYAYDEAGNLVEVVLPDGSTGTAVHNEQCRPVEVTEPGGAVWRHTYDERGNPLTTTDPAGAETRYGYDELGHLASVTDALGHTRHIACDPAGLPLVVTDPLGHATTVRRDAFGRVTEAVDPLGHSTRMGWTTEGRPSWREHPDGTRESWTWDGEGNILSHTDTTGNITRHTAGRFDLPASRTDPDGTTYTFAYDTELRLVGVTNPQGLTWSYEYDAAGRLVAESDFNGRTLAYAFDAVGDLASRTNGAGETLRYIRDALGRTTEQRGDTGGTTAFTYDGSGGLLRAVNADAEIVYERDVLGRVLSETVNGRTTTYAYDELGRRTRRVTPSGLASVWTYDVAGRPAELRGDAGALSFTYDAAGRETERRLGQDVALTQRWDGNDRLTAQVVRGGERLLQHREYAYREDGYLTEIRELTSGTRRFDLDSTGRVMKVNAHGWTERYAYDGAGNLTRASAPAHAAPGEREFEGTLIRRAGRTSYEHDSQGRLTRKVRRLLNGKTRTWAYNWDAEDRLTEAVTPEGERWRYAYDPLGRRLSKARVAGDGTVEDVSFTWDGARVAERTTSRGEVTTWDYAPGTPRPLTQTDHRPLVRSPGESVIEQFSSEAADPGHGMRFHAVVTDLVGSPTELITPQGELAWQRRTTLWGTDLPAPSDGSVDCPLRFPGQFFDPETGLHYNYFRYYDPEAARYVTADPLGLAPAPNHHAYVSTPHVVGDPLGLAPEECTKAQKPQKPQKKKEYPTLNELGKVGKDANQDIVSGGVSGQRLADQLRRESVGSVFTSDGKLRPQVISESRLVIPGEELNNPHVRAHLTSGGGSMSDWGKYTTRTHQSPYGDFQVHYYYNEKTGAVAYDSDYKMVMNRR